MKKIETTFDTLFKTISSILMSFIKHLAKFIVPVPPSFYWMQVVSESSGNQTVGIFAAVVLEIGGMLAAHFAIAFYGTAKGRIAAVLTGAYLVIGIGVMWLLESADLDSKLVITAIFIIAGMVYILSGMYEIEGQEQKQIEDDRAWERGQVEKDNELRRELERKQQEIDARKEVQLLREREQAKIAIAVEKTKVSTVNAEARKEKAAILARQFAASSQKTRNNQSIESVKHYECVCGKVFEGSRSYNAHRRHCDIPANEPVRIYENGSYENR